MKRLLSHSFEDIRALIDELCQKEFTDPGFIRNQYVAFYTKKDGSVVAPQQYQHAPFITYFVGWKEGFIQSQMKQKEHLMWFILMQVIMIEKY